MRKVVIMAALLAFSAGAARADREFSYHKDNKFDAAAVTSVRIDMPHGDIAIEKTTGPTIEVQYKNLVYAKDQAEADKLNSDIAYKAEIAGNVLEIKIETPDHPRHRKGLISRLVNNDWEDEYCPMIKISIPDGKSFNIESVSADIDAHDLKLDLDVRSVSSDISLETTQGRFACKVASGDITVWGHRGPVDIEGISSDIKLNDVEGDVNASTTSGDSEIEKIKGPVKISTTSGDNRIFDIDGALNIASASGDITVSGVTGSLRAAAISGDVRLSALSAKEGDFDVESISGDIVMEISSDFSGKMEVGTVSGEVNSQLGGELDSYSDSRLRGKIGDGRGRLSVSTTSGDISIDRY
jgi:DUF4097 and DUF4098 domain-containing protein YvlB